MKRGCQQESRQARNRRTERHIAAVDEQVRQANGHTGKLPDDVEALVERAMQEGKFRRIEGGRKKKPDMRKRHRGY